MQSNNIIKILGIVTILLISITTNISLAIIDDECEDKIIDSERAQAAKIDKEKAILIAMNNEQFKSITEGYTTEARTSHFTYTIDQSNCIAEISSIEVSFIKSDSITKEKLSLVTVVMDPELNVKDVIEDKLVYAGGNVENTNKDELLKCKSLEIPEECSIDTRVQDGFIQQTKEPINWFYIVIIMIATFGSAASIIYLKIIR